MEKIRNFNTVNTQNLYQTTVSRPFTFRAENLNSTDSSNSLEKTPETDVVEINKPPKKKISTLAKIGIGLGAGIATLVTAGILISKHQTSKISKLYKENLVLSNLGEHLEFKEAKTVEEGIKFAKEVLKIPEVDSNISLEAINIANKGLVDVSNAHKGKLFMPRGLHFSDLGDSTIAGVVRNINEKYFGHMAFNKNWFDHKFLNKELDEWFKIREFAPKSASNTGNQTTASSVEKTEKALEANDLIIVKWSDEFKNLANKYRQSADNLTLTEKRNLYGMLSETQKVYSGIFDRNPLDFMKNNRSIFEKEGININFEEISKLKTEEQSEVLLKALRELYHKQGGTLGLKSVAYTPERTVYHEMGHLQDYAENLKKLDLANWKKINFKDIYNDLKSGKNRAEVDEIENHWGAITKGNFKELLDKDPDKFKKLYPDMYEFLTNQEIQQTAGRISGYAQSGIGEFIAEAYAEMIKGRKLPEEIMTLYKKYGGPIPG